MSRYIDADKVLKIVNDMTECEDDYERITECVRNMPFIDIEKDYVPKDFHDKTCEAMAKAHQEEIANMVSVVRCKECDMSEVYQSDSNGVMARYCKAFTPTRMIADDDFCSYGERKEGE